MFFILILELEGFKLINNINFVYYFEIFVNMQDLYIEFFCKCSNCIVVGFFDSYFFFF